MSEQFYIYPKYNKDKIQRIRRLGKQILLEKNTSNLSGFISLPSGSLHIDGVVIHHLNNKEPLLSVQPDDIVFINNPSAAQWEEAKRSGFIIIDTLGVDYILLTPKRDRYKTKILKLLISEIKGSGAKPKVPEVVPTITAPKPIVEPPKNKEIKDAVVSVQEPNKGS